MYMWTQHFLFAKTARVKLDGILSTKKACLREGLSQGGVVSPTLFLVYISDVLTTTKKVSNTPHADDLAIWNASEHTTTATYRIQEAINSIKKCTLDWGFEINSGNTNSTLFSLSTSKEQIKLRLKDEIVPQTDTPTFLSVKLDTRLTCKPQIEKMERSSLQKLALMRKLAGTTWGADLSILTKVYTATIWLAMEYASTTWITAAKTNRIRLDKIQNMALRVILGAMKTTPVHDGKKNSQCRPTWEEWKARNPHPRRKTEKAAFPPSTHKPGTTHQKSPQAPKPEPPVQGTVQEISRHCGCASRATDRSCLEARQRGKRTTVLWVSQASPQRNSSLETPETSPLPWLLTDSLTMSGLMCTPTGLLRKEWKMAAAEST